MREVEVCAISPQCEKFRAIALDRDKSAIYMHIESGPLGKHWYWWKKGPAGTMLEDFNLLLRKRATVIAGKFRIKADA